MEKHAYLIIAHKNDLSFRTLIRMLDDPDNDIFIHFDAKCRDYSPKETERAVKYSRVYHTRRTDVRWGSFRQINAELLLLKLAVSKGSYLYYHLLSGQDLPIKSQEYIHSLLKNSTREYVEVSSDSIEAEYRVRYFHFWSPKLSVRENEARRKKVQQKEDRLHIWRGENIPFRKGANWFSVTDGFARYVIAHETWIRLHFMMTICGDELFLQTLLRQSPFWSNVYCENTYGYYSWNLRAIDWSRGNGISPWVYTMADLDALTGSAALFARKFDSETDAEIIKRIEELYT